jgi:uncharacterized protein YbbC (DUF1343 family)
MPAVLSGLDVLLSTPAWRDRLRGRRVALLANPTAITRDLTHAVEALQAAGVNLVRLFGPEHGVRAEAQDMEAVEQSVDPLSGLPVVSLYGHTFESLTPTAADLDGMDLLIADLQDIGARYYTFCYTIGLVMKACGEVGVPVWVLDRPNPINGVTMEGNIVDPSCTSFVGLQPLPTRHAMTMGELALFFERFGGWRCELEIVPMKGWRRGMWFDQTGLPWVMPSPNMPTLDTATVYPGQCLLEGTEMSEARGTTRPFELFGAPWIDAAALKANLDAAGIAGCAWRLASFKPMFQKHAGKICRGLQLHVTDRDVFRSLDASIAILSACYALFPEFAWRTRAYEFVDQIPAIDLLLGHPSLRAAIEAGEDARALMRAHTPAHDEFLKRRDACLIYREV